LLALKKPGGTIVRKTRDNDGETEEFRAAKAKENLTERSATESNNRKVTSMVENIISGLYLVGDVALLGLLVYNSHKPHNKTKRGWGDIHESEPIKGLRQQLHGLQGPQGKR
jgi:hypothetical protein